MENNVINPNRSTETSTAEHTCTNRTEQRLRALREAGVDTSNLWAMRGASGDETLVRLADGVAQGVDNEDPVFNAINAAGTIPDRHLFRRWVMSQMFRMLTYNTPRFGSGVSAALHEKGYEYQWNMILEELRVQAQLKMNDPENFADRNRWFNKDVCLALIKHYEKKLKAFVKSLTVRKCRGVPYVVLPGHKMVFVNNLNLLIYGPLATAASEVNGAVSPKELYTAMCKYNSLRIKLKHEESLCKKWVEAYKGSGAFYTLKNLILFHGCTLGGLNKEQSLERLARAADEYRNEGWRLLAFMKKAIDDNGIDIEAKRREWSDTRRLREACC